jgi:hypothetical protein
VVRRRWRGRRRTSALLEFTGCPCGKKICKAPSINNTANPVIVFGLYYFYQIAVGGGKPIILPMLTLSNGFSPLPDVNETNVSFLNHGHTNVTLHTR